MQIKDTLTPEVRMASPDMLVTDVARMMKEQECGCIPVSENDRLVGMITDRDIVLRCVAASQDPTTMTAAQCMSPGILYCYDTDDVEDVIQNMADNAIRRLPVVNSDKRLVGIVSLGDLSAACDNKETPGRALGQIYRAA